MVEIITVKLEPRFLLNTPLCICPLTFIVLSFYQYRVIKMPPPVVITVSMISKISTLYSLAGMHNVTMCCVTKTKYIHFVDDMCHIKKLKSCITGLTGYYGLTSYELTGRQTDRQIHQLSRTKVTSIKQTHTLACSQHMPGLNEH